MEKIKYKEIRYDDFKDYKWNGVQDEERCTKFLFHGSRKGLIDEDPAKIETFHNECDTFMSYLHKNLFRILEEMGLSRKEQYEKLHRLTRVEIYNKHKNFEYGDFYLTANYLLAASFSAYEAGELCDSCYQNAMDIKKLGIVFQDDEMNKLMERIIQKHEEYGKSESVILAVSNVLFDDMRDETGRAYKEIIRRQAYESKVSLNGVWQASFRLSNPNNYEFLLIHKAEFLKFIPLFTDIKEEEMDELKDSWIHGSTYPTIFSK